MVPSRNGAQRRDDQDPWLTSLESSIGSRTRARFNPLYTTGYHPGLIIIVEASAGSPSTNTTIAYVPSGHSGTVVRAR